MPKKKDEDEKGAKFDLRRTQKTMFDETKKASDIKKARQKTAPHYSLLKKQLEETKNPKSFPGEDEWAIASVTIKANSDVSKIDSRVNSLTVEQEIPRNQLIRIIKELPTNSGVKDIYFSDKLEQDSLDRMLGAMKAADPQEKINRHYNYTQRAAYLAKK